jgi:hypothetical protein
VFIRSHAGRYAFIQSFASGAARDWRVGKPLLQSDHASKVKRNFRNVHCVNAL